MNNSRSLELNGSQINWNNRRRAYSRKLHVSKVSIKVNPAKWATNRRQSFRLTRKTKLLHSGAALYINVGKRREEIRGCIIWTSSGHKKVANCSAKVYTSRISEFHAHGLKSSSRKRNRTCYSFKSRMLFADWDDEARKFASTGALPLAQCPARRWNDIFDMEGLKIFEIKSSLSLSLTHR